MNAVTVPRINIAELKPGDPDSAKLFADAIGSAMHDIGFVVVEGHGLRDGLMSEAYAVTEMLFNYPDDVLTNYELENGHATGFTPFKGEHAKDKPPELGDLKRFWHIRRPRLPGEPRRQKQGFVPNLWPDEVPEFRTVMRELFYALEPIGDRILGALDIYLDYQFGTLAGMVKDGVTLLRVIDYPDVGEVADDSIRSSEHEDINKITLLPAASASGLEVRTRDGVWIPVAETPDSIVVNVGDMLQMLTRKHHRPLISTTHRVINQPGRRFSFPCFIHARSEVVLDQETGTTAGEYLYQRLVEIGLIKP